MIVSLASLLCVTVPVAAQNTVNVALGKTYVCSDPGGLAWKGLLDGEVPPLDTVLAIKDRRWASFMTVPFSISTILTNCTAGETDRLLAYGNRLGLLYAMGRELKLCNNGSSGEALEIQEGLAVAKSVPFAIAARKDDPERVRDLRRRLSTNDNGRIERGALLEWLEAKGGIEETRALATTYAEDACTRLHTFTPSPWREALGALPEILIRGGWS